MMRDPDSPAEQVDILGLVVAALIAQLNGDGDGMELLLGDPATDAAVIGLLIGMVNDDLAPAAYGSRDEWARLLSVWQPGKRIGDDVE